MELSGARQRGRSSVPLERPLSSIISSLLHLSICAQESEVVSHVRTGDVLFIHINASVSQRAIEADSPCDCEQRLLVVTGDLSVDAKVAPGIDAIGWFLQDDFAALDLSPFGKQKRRPDKDIVNSPPMGFPAKIPVDD